MKIIFTKIPGCYEIFPEKHKDTRGIFVKTYNSKVFSKLGINNSFKEQYYTISLNNVIRGMHFQPHMTMLN